MAASPAPLRFLAGPNALEQSQAVEMAATAYDPADTIRYVVKPTETNG